MNKKFLDLGFQPLANEYLNHYSKKQKKYNLKISFNTKNKLVSISERMASKKMFTNNYPYRSSMSKTMRSSFKKLSKQIKKKFNPNLLLEIGSNDGALINNFSKKKVVGVEPCLNLARITRKKGYTTLNEYWDFKLSNKLKNKFKEFDLIYSANTLTHISNLEDVFRSIDKVLSEKGILIIEDPSLLECLKKNSYDQFYNEHIYVFGGEFFDNGGGVYSNVWEYSIASDTWQAVSHMPKPRHGLGAITTEEGIFVIAGALEAGGNQTSNRMSIFLPSAHFSD